MTVIIIANEKNDESFGNTIEWYCEKNKYLRMGISTSISYLGISIIRESTKILIVNSQFSYQLVGGGDGARRLGTC